MISSTSLQASLLAVLAPPPQNKIIAWAASPRRVVCLPGSMLGGTNLKNLMGGVNMPVGPVWCMIFFNILGYSLVSLAALCYSSS
jgi:hypothetical protein